MMLLPLLLAATPLSLDEVKAAARQNLDALRAELALTRAGLDRKDARSVIFPQVNLSLGASELLAGPQRRFTTAPQLQPDGSLTFVQRPVDLPAFAQGNFQLGLTVNQLLYDGGRWWSQLARTGALEEAAKGQLAEQQAASELEATRRFYELLRAQLVFTALEHQVTRSAELLERARGLFEAGRAQRRDALDAEVNLGNDRIAVLRQQQHVEAAQASLLQWLALPPADVEARAPAAFAAPVRAPSLTPAQLLVAARQRRPLFAVLDAQGRGGRLAVELARADYLPRVTASLGYGRSAPSGELFVDPTRQHSLTLGASLSWDLFNGLQTDALVERARTQLVELERQQRQTLLELESELVRATKALAAQHAIHRLAEQNRGLAETSFSAEQQRFAAGASTSLSVRDAQQRALAAELTALQTRVDVEVARAALERLAGAPLAELEQTP
ncbi:MAG: TolC family protein [Myxococcaceae bacterium]|jgi:outer membrane protein|nr:TolC family protein [Myxococcaceae bacterium]MCA3016261.1 TolC family protein [Myxococcaceae bacterium]